MFDGWQVPVRETWVDAVSAASQPSRDPMKVFLGYIYIYMYVQTAPPFPFISQLQLILSHIEMCLSQSMIDLATIRPPYSNIL